MTAWICESNIGFWKLGIGEKNEKRKGGENEKE